MAAAFFGTLARSYPTTRRQVPEVCNLTAPTASLKEVRRVLYIILGYGSYDAVARRTCGHNSWSSHTVVAAL